MAKVVEQYNSLKAATDFGLLDLASMFLGGIGILLAVFAFIAFYQIKELARKQAEETARNTASEMAEGVAVQRLEQELPNMIREYMELARNASDNGEVDEVARSQGDN